ncbi:MAG: hypothetical protein JRJ27_21020, partial [Deltaproteobacteria bacterium]|nr:hypothetical protein [Deltaproteobacteria bacterium]
MRRTYSTSNELGMQRNIVRLRRIAKASKIHMDEQPYIEGPDTEQTVHLAEYYAVLLRNKWIIVISLAVMV